MMLASLETLVYCTVIRWTPSWLLLKFKLRYRKQLYYWFVEYFVEYINYFILKTNVFRAR